MAALRERTRREPHVQADFARPVRTVRTFETAIENIIAGIEHAQLWPGDRLPNETELARQLAISKPTLRQALRVLERAGLLSVRPGKSGGIFLESEYLPTEEISRQVETEEHVVLDTLCARRLIETQVAHEAMRRATPKDLEEIERTVALLARSGLSRAQILRADMMFHRAVARATHNCVLDDALKVVYRHLAPIRDLTRQTEAELLETHDIHRAQLDAMIARDTNALDKMLDVHYHFLEDRFAASLGKSWAELFGARS